MEPYLSSIKQTSTLLVNNTEVKISFNIDPKSEEQDEIMYPIIVETPDPEIKEYLELDESGTFKGSLDDLNKKLEIIRAYEENKLIKHSEEFPSS